MNDARFEGLSRAVAGTSSRRQTLKLLGGGAAAGVLAVTGLRGASAGPGRPDSPFRDIAVTGTNGFTGVLDVKRFVVEGDELFAVGKLTGAVAGERIRPQNVSIPVTAANGVDLSGGAAARRVRAQAPCEILTLELGPLDLNLLGLRIQLNRIELVITAIPGGGLLGALLCAIADLLDGFNLGKLLDLAGLLNRLLRLLQRA